VLIISLVLKYPISKIVYLMLIMSQCNEFICTPIFFAWEKCFTREETLPRIRFHDLEFCISFFPIQEVKTI
jgi:hypothetical protein